MLIHGTCIAFGSRGLLILGEPGSGKSDLALRLIDRGAELVADDQVQLEIVDGVPHASAPEKLAGLIEIRGLGVRKFNNAPAIPITHVVKLVKREEVERMPEPVDFDCLGVRVPLLLLHAFDLSTEAKICLTLAGG